MTRLMLSFVILTMAGFSRADDSKPELLPPPKQAEKLPNMPKPVGELLPAPKLLVAPVPMGPMGPIFPGYFLPDRYAHTQFYARDQQGYLKPRVIFDAQPYYVNDGRPYYFLPTNPQTLMSRPISK